MGVHAAAALGSAPSGTPTARSSASAGTAEYELIQPQYTARDETWRFGHRGGNYYFERVQDGVVVREAEGTRASNPSFVEAVTELEQSARELQNTYPDEPMPGDRKGGGRSGRRWYDQQDFLTVRATTGGRTHETLRLLHSGRYHATPTAVRDAVDAARQVNEQHAKPVEGTDGGDMSALEATWMKVRFPLLGAAMLGAVFLLRR